MTARRPVSAGRRQNPAYRPTRPPPITQVLVGQRSAGPTAESRRRARSFSSVPSRRPRWIVDVEAGGLSRRAQRLDIVPVVTQPVLRTATAVDRERVIATIVAAFRDDPTFRYLFREEHCFTEHATAFAAYLFDKRVHRNNIWLIADGAAVALWDPPEPGDHVAATASLDLPSDVLSRLDAYDKAVQDHLPSTPHWYLGVLAPHPQYAGRRWGRRVMAVGLERAAEDGVPAYLETTTPRNVDLYRRSGWEIAATLRTGDLDIWVMLHRPGVASTFHRSE